jgi:hypothetical protein
MIRRIRADDPYGGRQATSHERREGRPWDASYLDGSAPWDIGEPQPAIVRLAAEGAFALPPSSVHAVESNDHPILDPHVEPPRVVLGGATLKLTVALRYEEPASTLRGLPSSFTDCEAQQLTAVEGM